MIDLECFKASHNSRDFGIGQEAIERKRKHFYWMEINVHSSQWNEAADSVSWMFKINGIALAAETTLKTRKFRRIVYLIRLLCETYLSLVHKMFVMTLASICQRKKNRKKIRRKEKAKTLKMIKNRKCIESFGHDF